MRRGPIFRTRSRLGLAAAALACLALAACNPPTPPSGQGLDTGKLDSLVGTAIGDPNTCLLLADATTGQVVYTYGAENCSRQLPQCDATRVTNARASLPFAHQAGGRMKSCPSITDGSRTVAWAEGPVQSKTRTLIYSAMMEGQNALPGIEMNARLYDAFQKAGL